jgi:hypothetical protein
LRIIAMREKCVNDRAGVEYRCVGGYLWELCYGEVPGNRQNTGRKCPACSPELVGKGGDVILVDDLDERDDWPDVDPDVWEIPITEKP